MQGKLHLRLTLDVTYDTNGVSSGELEDNLTAMVQDAFGDGLFTGETEAEVDTWEVDVETVPE